MAKKTAPDPIRSWHDLGFNEQSNTPGSVHLGWSSYAAVWLSRIPALIPGHFVSIRNTGTVRAEFDHQGARDWEAFLSLRARELRPGGLLVVVLPALADDGSTGLEPIFDQANDVERARFDIQEINFGAASIDHKCTPFWQKDHPDLWTVAARHKGRREAAPLRYVAFLQEAAGRLLPVRVGGGYIFVHRMLQEYFISLHEAEAPHTLSGARNFTRRKYSNRCAIKPIGCLARLVFSWGWGECRRNAPWTVPT